MMKRKIKGQALVELVLGVWIWGLSLASFVAFHRMLETQMNVMQSLRLGMRLKSIPQMSDEAVLDEMKQRLSQGQPSILRFKETAASQFFNLKKIIVNYSLGVFSLENSVVIQEGGDQE